MRHHTHDAKRIFLEAVEHYAPEERSRYLNEACHGDDGIRGQVEALLQAYAEPNSMLDGSGLVDIIQSPPSELDFALNLFPVIEKPGDTIGPYKLREQIGEGGMGLVFVAEQTEPVRRKVALKVCKPGLDTREVLSRFEAERQTLALMDDPNIAKVVDAGTTDSGRPYFVMELVRGTSITEYCEQARLGTRERLQLFIAVCQAVQHAHLKGIIHRDIKPSNVMVTLHDGVPVPKVIDFGVAKGLNQRLTEQTVYTQYQQLIGTPLYMSPEQAEFKSLVAGNYVTDVAWSPDGELVAAGIKLNHLKIWRPATGELVTHERVGDHDGHGLYRIQLAWHPSGDLLAGSTPEHWFLLNASDWTITRQERMVFGRGSDIDWCPDGKRFAVADGESIQIWNPEAPEPERSLLGHPQPISALDWSPDGQQLVSSYKLEEIKVWDLNKPNTLKPISTGGAVTSISWLADSERLSVVGAADQALSIWRISDGRRESVRRAPNQGDLWSPTGQLVAARRDSDPPEVQIIDGSSGDTHSIWRADAAEQVSISANAPHETMLAWSPDETMLAIAQKGGEHTTIDLWDVNREQVISTWRHHWFFERRNGEVDWNEPDEIVWSPDGSRIAVAAKGEVGDNGTEFWQGHVYIVDVETGILLLCGAVTGMVTACSIM